MLAVSLLTGIAIVLYISIMPPYQPRERDYAFAGSFYAFAIWVGLGVMAIHDLFMKRWVPAKSLGNCCKLRLA
jgi:hypothetical protein